MRGGGAGTAIVMILTLGVIPMAILGGIVGGGIWLGAKAVAAIATTGSLAGVFTPLNVLGGIALLGAGQFTGINQVIAEKTKSVFNKLFRKGKPAKPPKQPAPPSAEWTQMAQDLNAKNAFRKSAAQPKADTPAPEAPKPADPKPPQP